MPRRSRSTMRGDEWRSVSSSEPDLVRARIASTELKAPSREACELSSSARAHSAASFGAALSRRGHEVTLLGRRSPHLQALRERGLKLETRDCTSEHVTIAATDDPAVIGAAETVIVLVKVCRHNRGDGRYSPLHSSRSSRADAAEWIGKYREDPDHARHRTSNLGGRHVSSRDTTPSGFGHAAGEGPTLVGYWMNEMPGARASSPEFSPMPDSQPYRFRTSTVGSGGNSPSVPRSTD